MITVRQYRQMLTTMQTMGTQKRPRRAVRRAALAAFNQSNILDSGLRVEIGALIAKSLPKN